MSLPSNVEWKFWGKTDPLWGVASWNGRRKDGSNPWTAEEFYDLGRTDWEDFIGHWVVYGLDKLAVVEIGCGAGRLTKHMAKDFASVYALDVSEEMVRYARKHAGSSNVAYCLVSGSGIPIADNSVTAAFSTHVFQHLHSKGDVSRYFEEISRVLAPQGSMMIHLPIFVWPYGAGRLVRAVFRASKLLYEIKVRIKRAALRKARPISLMSMRSYGLDYIYSCLPRLGFDNIEIWIFPTKSNNDPHPFVMARKTRDFRV